MHVWWYDGSVVIMECWCSPALPVAMRWAYLTFFVSALPFLLLMTMLQGLPLVVVAGGFVLFSLGMQPIENSLVAVLSPPRWRSVTYGVKFTLVFGAGSLAVYMVGFVEGRHGIDAGQQICDGTVLVDKRQSEATVIGGRFNVLNFVQADDRRCIERDGIGRPPAERAAVVKRE